MLKVDQNFGMRHWGRVATLGLLAFLPSSAFSQLAVSTDLTTSFQDTIVRDDVTVRFDGSLPLTTQSLGLPDVADIGALHVVDGSTLLFAVKSSLRLDSGYGSPGDVLQWSSGAVTVFASRDELGLGPGTAVDAISMQGDVLIYSIDVADVVGGTAFTDSDLLQWTTAGGPSLFLSESTCGIPQVADVVATHVLDAQNVLFAFRTVTSIGGDGFRPGDIVRCNLVSGEAVLYERITSEDPRRQATKIDAVSVFRGTTVLESNFESP